MLHCITLDSKSSLKISWFPFSVCNFSGTICWAPRLNDSHVTKMKLGFFLLLGLEKISRKNITIDVEALRHFTNSEVCVLCRDLVEKHFQADVARRRENVLSDPRIVRSLQVLQQAERVIRCRVAPPPVRWYPWLGPGGFFSGVLITLTFTAVSYTFFLYLMQLLINRFSHRMRKCLHVSFVSIRFQGNHPNLKFILFVFCVFICLCVYLFYFGGPNSTHYLRDFFRMPWWPLSAETLITGCMLLRATVVEALRHFTSVHHLTKYLA